MKRTVFIMSALAIAAAMPSVPSAQRKHQNAVIDLWTAGKPAFGVFVPNENAPQRGGVPSGGAQTAPSGTARGPQPPPLYTREGGERLAANPLYDYVFLNLEGRYDAAAVKAIAEGLRSPKAAGRKTLIVRVPAFHDDAEAGRTRLREVFAAGADGITFPHVQSVDEGRRILEAVRAEKIDVWSPATPNGEKLVMMMLEDPGAVAQAGAFADLGGFSILACGIGSLRAALGGDAAQAEAGVQKVLAETKRAKLPNMLTANAQDVEKRIKEGFLALLMQGAQADDAIKIGRAAAGR